MYGLLINRLYLEEILDGRKKCDARPFPTGHRGRIALLDNKNLKLFGFADLSGVRKVGYREFRSWQTTLHYQIPEDPLGDRKSYYFYDLENTVRIAEPKSVKTYPCDHVWVYLRDTVRKDAVVQKDLFSF